MLHARPDYNRIQDPDGKIPEDEPVFLIRAQDPLFDAMLEYYIGNTMRIGGQQEIIDCVEKHRILGQQWPVRKKHADI